MFGGGKKKRFQRKLWRIFDPRLEVLFTEARCCLRDLLSILRCFGKIICKQNHTSTHSILKGHVNKIWCCSLVLQQMAPLKSPCVWYSRPSLSCLLKPNVRTSPQRHPLWVGSDSASVILVRMITSKCPSSLSNADPQASVSASPVHRGERVVSEGLYRVSKAKGSTTTAADSRCAVLHRGLQIRHWLLPVPVFIQIVPRAPACTRVEFWCEALRCSEKSPGSDEVSC